MSLLTIALAKASTPGVHRASGTRACGRPACPSLWLPCAANRIARAAIRFALPNCLANGGYEDALVECVPHPLHNLLVKSGVRLGLAAQCTPLELLRRGVFFRLA